MEYSKYYPHILLKDHEKKLKIILSIHETNELIISIKTDLSKLYDKAYDGQVKWNENHELDTSSYKENGRIWLSL